MPPSPSSNAPGASLRRGSLAPRPQAPLCPEPGGRPCGEAGAGRREGREAGGRRHGAGGGGQRRRAPVSAAGAAAGPALAAVPPRSSGLPRCRLASRKVGVVAEREMNGE